MLAIIVFILLLAACYGLSLLNLSSIPGSEEAGGTVTITYEVRASGREAIVAYKQSNGEVTEAEKVETPWSQNQEFSRGERVTLSTYLSVEMSGDIECRIYQNGVMIDRDSGTFEDKAACGALLR